MSIIQPPQPRSGIAVYVKSLLLMRFALKIYFTKQLYLFAAIKTRNATPSVLYLNQCVAAEELLNCGEGGGGS